MSRPFGPQVKPFGPPARAASTKTDSFPSFSTLATRARMVSQKTMVPSGKAIGPSVPCNVTPGSPCPGTFAMTTSIFVPPLTTPGISSATVSVGGTSGVPWPRPWLDAAAEPKRDTAARIISVRLMDCVLQCLTLYARLVSPVKVLQPDLHERVRDRDGVRFGRRAKTEHVHISRSCVNQVDACDAEMFIVGEDVRLGSRHAEPEKAVLGIVTIASGAVDENVDSLFGCDGCALRVVPRPGSVHADIVIVSGQRVLLSGPPMFTP